LLLPLRKVPQWVLLAPQHICHKPVPAEYQPLDSGMAGAHLDTSLPLLMLSTTSRHKRAHLIQRDRLKDRSSPEAATLDPLASGPLPLLVLSWPSSAALLPPSPPAAAPPGTGTAAEMPPLLMDGWDSRLPWAPPLLPAPGRGVARLPLGCSQHSKLALLCMRSMA
jgi:hypothetical protein